MKLADKKIETIRGQYENKSATVLSFVTALICVTLLFSLSLSFFDSFPFCVLLHDVVAQPRTAPLFDYACMSHCSEAPLPQLTHPGT